MSEDEKKVLALQLAVRLAEVGKVPFPVAGLSPREVADRIVVVAEAFVEMLR